MKRCCFLLLAMAMAYGLTGCIGGGSLRGTVDGKEVDLNLQTSMLPGFGPLFQNGGNANRGGGGANTIIQFVQDQKDQAGRDRVLEDGADTEPATISETVPDLKESEDLIGAGKFGKADEDAVKNEEGGDEKPVEGADEKKPEDFVPVGGAETAGAEDFVPVGGAETAGAEDFVPVGGAEDDGAEDFDPVG